MIWGETAVWKSQKVGKVGWSGKEDGFNMKRTEETVAPPSKEHHSDSKLVQEGCSGQSVYEINQCRITWSFCEKKTTMALT